MAADLSRIQFNTQTWSGLKDHLKDLRETESRSCEQSGMPEGETENHRGAIRIIDAILGLEEPKPEMPAGVKLSDSA